MKGKWLAALVFILALTGGTTAMATNGDAAKSIGNSQSTNSMPGMDMSGSQKDNNMAGMDMSGSPKDTNMPGMDMGEGPVKETPANSKVLGTFGAVNLAFILIGVWNKWSRRKDVSHGNSK